VCSFVVGGDRDFMAKSARDQASCLFGASADLGVGGGLLLLLLVLLPFVSGCQCTLFFFLPALLVLIEPIPLFYAIR